MRDAQRTQLSRFGPREGHASKRIRRWAEVGSSAELGAGGHVHGWLNLPAVVLVVLCALLLIRGASESAVVNTVMVCIKLGVLGLFSIIAFTAFQADHFANFAPFGVAALARPAG